MMLLKLLKTDMVSILQLTILFKRIFLIISNIVMGILYENFLWNVF